MRRRAFDPDLFADILACPTALLIVGFQGGGGGGGGGGLNQLTGDVLAGPGTGSQVAEVVGLLSETLPSLSAGYLFWSGSVFEWASSGGLNQLTGDVLAGPGTGSQVAEVVGLLSETLPSLSAGYLFWSGSVFEWASSAVGTLSQDVSNIGEAVTVLQAQDGELKFRTDGSAYGFADSGSHTGYVLGNCGNSGDWTALTLGYANANYASGGSNANAYAIAADQNSNVFVNAPGGGNLSLQLSGVPLINLPTGTAGTLQWQETTVPLLEQVATTSATGANFTLQPQQSTSGGGSQTGGRFVVDLQTPGGTGSEAAFEIDRGATPVLSGKPFPGLAPSYFGLWFGSNAGAANETTQNFGFLGSSTTIQFNGPTAGSTTYFTIGGSLTNAVIQTASGFEFFGTSAAFGGGSGVLKIDTATTLPASAPAGGVLLAQSAVGLYGFAPSPYLTKDVRFPAWQGSVNSQGAATVDVVGCCETGAGSPATGVTIPVASSATGIALDVMVIGRDTTTGDIVVMRQLVGFKNVSGTVTQTSTTAALERSTDSTLATSIIVYTISGTNVEIQPAPPISHSTAVDWTVSVRPVIFN